MPFDGWRLPVSNSDMQSRSYNHLQGTGWRGLIASSRDGSCQPPSALRAGRWQSPYTMSLGFQAERTELALVNYLHGTGLGGSFRTERLSLK